MNALHLISDTLPPLRTSDTGEVALQLMADYQVKQLPIVNNEQFLGLIAEEDILEQGMLEDPIGNRQLSYYKPYVNEADHIYQVLRTAANLKLSLIPVVDLDNNYKGIITLEALLAEFAQLSSITDPGGILELEVNVRDYSLTEISRIVESNDATILSLYTTNRSESTQREITLKLNKEDLRAVMAAFERFGYTIRNYYQKSDFEEDLRDRYESFIRYLNI